ncbi:MAG: hypothetical protein V7750_01690 [Sneathiella sp.]
MSFKYSIDTEKNLILIRYSGTITDTDVGSVRHKLTNDSRFNTQLDEIVDFSDVKQFEISMAFNENVAKNPLLKPTSTVIFIVPTDVSFGTARSFISLSGKAESNVHACRNYAEAEEILCISDLRNLLML